MASTGYAFDEDMLRHANPWDSRHIESPERLSRSHARCAELGLLERCHKIPSRRATDDELTLAHSQEHLSNLKSLIKQSVEEIRLATLAKSVYVNEHSLDAARLAAAAAVDLTSAVVKGELRNAMGLVRPPGHHATKGDVCGFCLCNNVAIGARHALRNLGLSRILIVDFDVHHGQATQYEFYDDPRVLYISIHRYENGRFWPHLRESDYDHTGGERAKGFNINIPLNEPGLDDSDYMAIFHQVILPASHEFNPELVLVSAGFDAALGCPEGEMEVSPLAYGHFVKSLMSLAGGKLVVMLEGGYFVDTLAEGVAMSLRTLLGDPALRLGPLRRPKESVIKSILNVITAVKGQWKWWDFRETYPASGSLDENCHVPQIVYEGQEMFDERQENMKSDDPDDYFSTNTEEQLETFRSIFQDMKKEYASRIHANKGVVANVALPVAHGDSVSVLHPSPGDDLKAVVEAVMSESYSSGIVYGPQRHFDRKLLSSSRVGEKFLHLHLGHNETASTENEPNLLNIFLHAGSNIASQQLADKYNVRILLPTLIPSAADVLCPLFNIVLPISYEFDPDLVLISVDDCEDPKVEILHAYVLHHMQSLAGGKVVLIMSDSARKSYISLLLSALCGEPLRNWTHEMHFSQELVSTLQSVGRRMEPDWKCLNFGLKIPK